MKKSGEIPVNELGKLFYCFDLLGSVPMQRRHFEFQGGHIDLNTLRKACQLELRRYPLLNSLLEDRSSWLKWNIYWVPRKNQDADELIIEEDLSSLSPEEAEERFEQIRFDPFSDFDLLKQPPFLLVLLKFPNKNYRLLTFFHHAAVDGTGYIRFLTDLFKTYNLFITGVNPGNFTYSSPVSTSSTLLPTSFVDRIKGAASAIRYLLKQSIPVKGKKAAKIMDKKGPFTGQIHAVQRSFSQDKMRKYLDVSRTLNTTFNNFFVAKLIKSFEEWENNRHKECGTVYVQVLKNLRKKNCSSNEIQNRFVTIPFTVLEEDLKSTKDTIESIKAQNEFMNKKSICEKTICLLWPLNFAVVRKLLPVWGNFIFNNPKVIGTFVVSNMGRLWTDKNGNTEITHLGNAEIKSTYTAGFPVPSVGNFMTLCTYKGKLFLTFNYYIWCISKEEIENFMDFLVDTMDKT